MGSQTNCETMILDLKRPAANAQTQWAFLSPVRYNSASVYLHCKIEVFISACSQPELAGRNVCKVGHKDKEQNPAFMSGAVQAQ